MGRLGRELGGTGLAMALAVSWANSSSVTQRKLLLSIMLNVVQAMMLFLQISHRALSRYTKLH